VVKKGDIGQGWKIKSIKNPRNGAKQAFHLEDGALGVTLVRDCFMNPDPKKHPPGSGCYPLERKIGTGLKPLTTLRAW